MSGQYEVGNDTLVLWHFECFGGEGAGRGDFPSLYYASQTGKQPGILLILENKDDNKYLDKLKKTIDFHKLGIQVWTMANKKTKKSLSPRVVAALENVSLYFTFKKSQSGFIAFADFTIENKNVFLIDDVTILCRYYDKSGTQMDKSTKTMLAVVSANGSKKFDNFYMGFLASNLRRDTG